MSKYELKKDDTRVARSMGHVTNKEKRKRNIKLLAKTLRDSEKTFQFIEDIAACTNPFRFYKDVEDIQSFFKLGREE